MGIHLCSGTPGAGKTLRTVWTVLKLMTEFPERPVFSNINGFKRSAPLPEQWMDCPDGSIIVIDECQQRWRRYRNTGEPPLEIAALETHRHRGIDFYITCQNPSQLTSDVRALVEVHEHLMRKGKLSGAILWRWEGVCHTNPASHKSDADCEASIWRHPKHVYPEYQSATIHTGKKRLPRILIMAPAVFIAAGLAVTYAISSVTGYSVNQAVASDSSTAASVSRSSPSSADSVMAYGGVSDGTRCRLYDVDGNLIQTTFPECLEALENGLPYPVNRLSL